MVTESIIPETVKERADKILADLELPPEIESISTNLGEDASGDAALFIHLRLAKEAAKKKAHVRTLADFTERVQVLLMGNGITYFPYVFLDEAA